jgi:hypothetical protein
MDLWLGLSNFKTNLITLIYSSLFKRKSLIMKNISTGFGLCAIAAAVALYPVLDRFAPIGKEAHAGIPVSAITSAALAQTAPTIVWYGTNAYTQVIGSGTGSRQSACGEILRGWSDGRVEVMTTRREITGYNGSQIDLWCTDGGYCTKPWILVSTPAQGYAAATDINADTSVDGADLAMMLGNWGDAPRHDIPPSDCPLNLINP